VYDITREGVVQSTQKLKNREELHEITKEVLKTTIESLVDAEESSAERLSAALHGMVDGLNEVESQILETTHNELHQLKKHVRDDEAKMTEGLCAAIGGARAAADNLTGEVKESIEIAATDVKLKSTELLGFTRDTVKEAVHKAICTGMSVETTVVEIVRNATAKVLGEENFTEERARKVSESVLSSAVEAAEGLGINVNETASAAAEGVSQGLGDVLEQTRKNTFNAGKNVKEFAVEDLEQTMEDLEVVGDLFIATLRKVADNSGEAAKDILHELAHDAKKAGSTLREKAVAASHAVAERLIDMGKTGEVSGKAVHILGKEIKELSEQIVDVENGLE